MAIKLKQSTASQEIVIGPFLDSSNGDDEETGLTIANTDLKLWKMGATTLANKNSGGGTHISNGIYYATLDATDTDTLGALVIFCHVSGALAIKVECEVLSANIYDSWIAGTDNLEVDSTALETKIDTIDGVVDAILIDTDELQTDWANGGRLDSILDTAASGDATETKQDTIIVHLTDVKGTGFVKDTHSLVDVTSATPVNLKVTT